MSAPLRRVLILVAAASASAGIMLGCGSSNGTSPSIDGGMGRQGQGSVSSTTGSRGSSNSSSNSTSSSVRGEMGDAGCVFETLVTNLITDPPDAAIPCSEPLCGCTDNGQLIKTVPGFF